MYFGKKPPNLGRGPASNFPGIFAMIHRNSAFLANPSWLEFLTESKDPGLGQLRGQTGKTNYDATSSLLGMAGGFRGLMGQRCIPHQ